MRLFMTDDLVGRGLPMFLPNGYIIWQQLFLVAESNAVDAGQHLVLFVILPVSDALLGDLERLQSLGVGQVGSDAHINEMCIRDRLSTFWP